jgi:DNA-binding transcriptional regulator YhcF (GntR family)
MIEDRTMPVYKQLAEKISDDILRRKYSVDERIPSMREVASEFQININTAQRAFDLLQQNGIIYKERGMGYYVSKDAYSLITKMRKDNFVNETLPSVFATMQTLNIPMEDIIKTYNQSNINKK